MQIQTSMPLANATQTASNALNMQFTHLNSISQSINHSLVSQNKTADYTAPNYSVLDSTLNKNSMSNTVESNLLDLNTTKLQSLSLLKVMEVENNNINSSLGKIFDNWA
ncbi:hypothetical protein JCM30760_13530 [Thiomicrorhabdus hydrogeniphila]